MKVFFVKIKFSSHLITRCGIKIYYSTHGVRQFDIMLFGLCFYSRLPRINCIEQIHYAAGIWKSNCFANGIFLTKAK